MHWRRWGPYLSERQWGTVREDYSADGDAWGSFPHDHARSRAYRWGEDGIFGFSDSHQQLCFAPTFWNGRDPILKERLFGLSGPEGNHGEDVKEVYYFLDGVPSHAYMKALYKYPQAAYPYEQLLAENGRRTRLDPEYELVDTGVFNENRYFDIFVEYAKYDVEDIAIALTIVNRGPDRAALHVLPTLWFRNTWSWSGSGAHPWMRDDSPARGTVTIAADCASLGVRRLICEGTCTPIFCENETNKQRLFGVPNDTRFPKDAFHAYLIGGDPDAVNPNQDGTKAAAHYELDLAPGESKRLRLRLTDKPALADAFAGFDALVETRRREADEFYAEINPYPLSDDVRAVQRQAFAGLLWSKQFYHYSVYDWLKGDPKQPPPPPGRKNVRNHDWRSLYSEDVLSMPDTWEFPWFASWDLAFHMIPLAVIDADFAKSQLIRLTREWYMHPSGQLPAYEWSFSDTNPPVHAWAALRVFQIDRKMNGEPDYGFLERVFQKLLMNFTWWVNKRDFKGDNIFAGGFLGLDNIGVFDRSAGLPAGGMLNQADATSWMGVYALNMLSIAVELAQVNPAYEDIASKFFEHFLSIAQAMNSTEGRHHGLWDEDDGFYYDSLAMPGGEQIAVRVRSMVGLIPLIAVETIDASQLEKMPNFRRRVQWFFEHRKDLAINVAAFTKGGIEDRKLIAIADPARLLRVLQDVFDESRFLSPYGIRSLSKFHETHPYRLDIGGKTYEVGYEPAESKTGLFGGNSNWRGPIWFPINYLLIEALQKFHYYYGDTMKVEFPTGSGDYMTLWDVSTELSHRMLELFARSGDGRRPIYGDRAIQQHDPHWRDYVQFFEYFHGDTGAGLGASHQTGWTGLAAKLIQQCAEYCGLEKDPLEGQEHHMDLELVQTAAAP